MNFDPKFIKAMEKSAKQDTPVLRVACLADGKWVVILDREFIFMNAGKVYVLPPLTEIELLSDAAIVGKIPEDQNEDCIQPIGTIAEFKAFLLQEKELIEEKLLGRADPDKLC